MESTPQNNQNILLDSIDLHTSGIIWVPHDSAPEASPLIHDLDYFFDGIIMSGIHHHGKDKDFSLFTTNNFGKELKLGLIPNNAKFSDYLNTFLGLVTKEQETFKIILIQNKEDKSLEKLVSNKLDKFKKSMLEKLYL